MGKLRQLFGRVRRTEPTCCEECRRAARAQPVADKSSALRPKTTDQ